MNNELYHHGVPNQKWGQRLYQNKDGSLTALGRIHYGIGKKRKASTSVKITKEPKKTRKEIKAEKAAAEAAKKEALRTKNKDEAMVKADVTYAMKNTNQFTTQELSDLINRYNKIQEVSKLGRAEIEAGKKFTYKKMVKLGKDLTDAANQIANAAEATKKVLKALGYIEEKDPKKKGKQTVSINTITNQITRTTEDGNGNRTIVTDVYDKDKK